MSTETYVEDAGSPVAKKIKLDTNDQPNPEENIHHTLTSLAGFNVSSILSNNTNRKTVCLRGTFDSQDGEAIVILEKTAFVGNDLKQNKSYFKDTSFLEQVFQNDIYGNYKYFPNQELSVIKTTIIHPATNKHIVKFSTQKCYIVDETPAIYKEVVLPGLTDEQLHLQWVYNILDHTSEVDRIVFEDLDPVNGFMLVPDLKWNGEIDTLYLLAIVNRRDVKSLRDLTGEHLELLKNIQNKGVEAIESKYSLDKSRLRIYLHYQPSFYHLHVHFCYLQHEAPGILTEKAHLLSHVISNIELLPDYYQKVTIPFLIKQNDKLFKKFEEKGLLKSS